MFRSFWSMPPLLKFLTGCSVAAPLCVLQTVLPGGHVTIVGGERITNALWWRYGAGVVYAVPALLVTVGALGMLRRARGSRALFLGGFLLSYPAVLWIPRLVLGRSEAGFESVVPGLVLALLIAAYLYASPAVRSYFRGEDPRGPGVSAGELRP